MPDQKIGDMPQLSNPPPATTLGLMVPVVRIGDPVNYRVPAQSLLITPAQVDGSGLAGLVETIHAGDADPLGTGLTGGGLTISGGDSSGTGGIGGDVDISPGVGDTANGVLKIAGDASVVAYNHAWIGGFNPNGAVLLIAARPMIVTAIIGRLGAAEGAVATLALYKAPSGTAIAAGTALTTNTFNANGTPDANQILTLEADAVITLAAGDAIGIVTAGTWAANYGTISLWLTFGPT